MLNRISSFAGPLSKLFSNFAGFTILGLILRYELKSKDSYSGTTTITDLIGNSNATLTNSPVYSLNGYINFDGSNDYLITNTSLNSKLSPPDTSTIISYFLWIYPMDNGVIVTEQGSSSLNSIWHDSQIEMVSGNLEFGVWNGLGSTSFVSSISTPLYNWYYVGLTYDGSTLRGYINAQLAGSISVLRSSPYSVGAGLYYGLGATDLTNLGDGSYAKMKLGAFHVYNTAPTSQQVLNNYNIQKSNYIHTEDMLIWIDANDPQSFTDGTIFDISGNNYHHTLSGGATSTNINGIKSFDCTTDLKRIEITTGPTLPTIGYTYVIWARATDDDSLFRTLLYTKTPRYTPITIPNGTNTLGYWDSAFRSSGYDLTSSIDRWIQYAIVGDSSSQTFYINGSQVGSSIAYGSGGTLHFGLGNNGDGVSQPFGYVGNMILYNKKLTQAQIKQNYDALKQVYDNSNFVISNLVLFFNPASLLSYPGTGTTVYNLSSSSLNGTLSNITFQKTYFDFNGSNSQIAISDSSSLEPGSGDWTTEVWFNATSLSSSSVILGKFDNGGASQDVSYSIRTNLSGQIFSQIGNGTIVVNSTFYTLSLSTWYQVVYVWKNVSVNSLETYINGTLVGTVSHAFASILNSSNNLYLGSYNNGEYSQYFNGDIGIVRIYNSALSGSDVLRNFECNKNIYGL
jgi:hypothetical protein